MKETPSDIESVIGLVRPEVRRAHEYVVGSAPRVDVKLNQNESPFGLPEEITEDLLQAVKEVDANRYPAEFPARLRAALAAAAGHPEEGIVVGNGSNELTYTLGMTFVGPNTPVVLPRPMFALYESMVGLHGGVVVPVPPLNDLSFDVDGIVEAMRRTRAPLTVVTTPNNPTGLALTRKQVEYLVEAAPGILVVDEAYVEFNSHGSVVDLIPGNPHLVIMRTLSKAFGLAGLRVGYLLAHPRLVAEIMKARLPFMVDRLAEAASLSVLRHGSLVADRVARMKQSTIALTEALQEMEGVEPVRSSTNFVIFRTPLEPTMIMDRLAGQGILIRNMAGYAELKGFLRVTAGTDTENRRFLQALESAIAGPTRNAAATLSRT